MNSESTRGFVTIATGDDRYYSLALYLLESYRYTSAQPLPFAILCDRENEITEQFDRVILMSNPTHSYIDKLRLGEYLPFDETVFIDADCLAYSDLNGLFDIFHDATDVSCLGMTEPLAEQNNGWFSLLSFPESAHLDGHIITREEAKKRIPYCVGLHGGMLYMRKSKLTGEVFRDALSFAEDYSFYRFRLFRKPADEPVLALSMALHNCLPIPYERFELTCFWTVKNPKLDMYHQKAHRIDGIPIRLLHWGTKNTKTPIYKKQITQLHLRFEDRNGIVVWFRNLINDFLILCYRIKRKWRALRKNGQ